MANRAFMSFCSSVQKNKINKDFTQYEEDLCITFYGRGKRCSRVNARSTSVNGAQLGNETRGEWGNLWK